MASRAMTSLVSWLLAAALCQFAGAFQKAAEPLETVAHEITSHRHPVAWRMQVAALAEKVRDSPAFMQQHVHASPKRRAEGSDGRFLPALYQNADDLINELTSLASAGRCATPFETTWEADEKTPDKKVFVVRMGQPSAPKNILLVANTHAREAITAEVVKNFIKWACEGSDSAQALLAGLRFTVVPVLNLGGRRIIDAGSNPCQRHTADEGEGEVDLNRNMDVDFEASEGHGDAPFSTYQARILRRLAAAEKPLAYVDLHSGYKSLMVPWGSKSYTTTDFPAQNKILSKVARTSCPECEIGSNCKVIGYRNPGEIMDHMYKKQGIKHSTLWEIYVGDTTDECLPLFNPLDRHTFDSTVTRWTTAVQTFAEEVHQTVGVGERATSVADGALLAEITSSGRSQTNKEKAAWLESLPMPVKDAPGAFLTT